MASSNPANFANLPKDELKEIAAKGGHASHGAAEPSHPPGRNPDGTFTQGSEVAKELGAKGGHIAHEHQVAQATEDSDVSHSRMKSLEHGLTLSKRNPNGTFKKGSELAHDLGVKGGHAAHQ